MIIILNYYYYLRPRLSCGASIDSFIWQESLCMNWNMIYGPFAPPKGLECAAAGLGMGRKSIFFATLH